MKCPYCEQGTNDFVMMNQTRKYSRIEISVNRQGMLRTRVFDDNGCFSSQDIVEIHYCSLCCKQSSKKGQISPQSIPVLGRGFATKYTSGKVS